MCSPSYVHSSADHQEQTQEEAKEEKEGAVVGGEMDGEVSSSTDTVGHGTVLFRMFVEMWTGLFQLPLQLLQQQLPQPTRFNMDQLQ